MQKKNNPYTVRLTKRNIEELEKIAEVESISKNGAIRMAIGHLYADLKKQGMI